MMKKIFAIFIGVFVVPAHADQCALMNYKTMIKAYKILKQSKSYTDYCPLCDGDYPKIKSIDSVEYRKDKTYYEIYINNEPIDLAYTYVNNRNLGIQVDCHGIRNVPEFIDNQIKK